MRRRVREDELVEVVRDEREFATGSRDFADAEDSWREHADSVRDRLEMAWAERSERDRVAPEA